MSKQEKCASESSCGACESAAGCDANTQQLHTERLLKEKLSRIKHRIVVMSGKGGVGKSTVAVNLAVALAQKGHSVGILDGDVHGPNVPKLLGMDGVRPTMSALGLIPAASRDNVKVISMAFLLDDPDTPVAWRGPMKHGLFQQFLSDVDWGDLDFLVVDLPPGTGDEPLSIAQILGNPLWAVIVTTPQDVALLDSRKSVVFARSIDLNVVGIVENMSGFVCPKCGETIDLFKRGGGERASRDLMVPFLGAIPLDPEIVLCGDAGQSLASRTNGSATADAIRSVADGICLAVTGESGK
ncbi:MAG: Mrp/NBP35 family ATP-binding protein [Desulfomonilaceae bacterium]|nr:Mrp/NBP35 family ATP-binding protein [Desulfomonilaceae bacterium]